MSDIGNMPGMPVPPSDSSSFLASCSRRMLSRLGSRATLLSDVSRMLRISRMSSPVRAERLKSQTGQLDTEIHLTQHTVIEIEATAK